MADKLVNNWTRRKTGRTNEQFVERYADLGDGTYAQVVQVGGTPPASNVHLGQVGGHATVLELVLSLDTNQYASGDVLAATQELANVLRVAGANAILDMVRVLDEDDQGGAFDILIFDSNVDIGTENAAFDITDTEARSLLGWMRVASTDYEDWGGFRTANLKRGDAAFKADVLKPAAGTSVYVAVVSRDTKPYTASGIRLQFHIFQD